MTPALVLRSTGSVGVSLLFWAFGTVIGMSALLVWLELGLSIPKFELANRDENDTVREGGPSLQCKSYFPTICNRFRVYREA